MALLRMRRYRFFVIGTALVLFLLYRLSQNSQLNPSSITKGYNHNYNTPSAAESRPVADSAGAAGGGGKGKGNSNSNSNEAAAPAKAAPAAKESAYAPKPLTSVEAKDAFSRPTSKVAAGLSSSQQTQVPAPAAVPVPVPAPAPPAVAAPVPAPAVAQVPAPAAAAAPAVPPARADDAADTERVLRVDPPGALQESVVPLQVPGAAAAPGQPTPSPSTIHWRKMPEHYPLPAESIIPLPTGSPKAIPRIQHRFADETVAQREVREARLASVRREMQHAWSGYRQFAWTHDELVPVAQTFRDPFCGWAATMVDALDTLWIMGMVAEFDEAYAAVRAIDFTTTPYRSEIPVFETTIRYLGGLIAAYDVTGGAAGNYPALLTKAVELAEILMGVFDTPNRMPVLYYNWKPAFMSQPATASTSASIAELGSLTMEFTRLAQVTGDNRYYDAVARIVDALEEWQNRPGGTALPGIFPDVVDASGCNRSTAALQEARLAAENLASELAQAQMAKIGAAGTTEPVGYQPGRADEPVVPAVPQLKTTPVTATPAAAAAAAAGEDELVNVYGKRYVKVPGVSTPEDPIPSPGAAVRSAPIKADGSEAEFQCIPQNLTAGGYGRESFGMGGSQDSTYEYFPKQFLLLGGLVPKYRAMHEKVVAAVSKYLLYRPMIKDAERSILFSAKVGAREGSDQDLYYHYEVTHLTCFLGGMFAMGGRIFDRPDDVATGARLADGCVWAYETMPLGIMPEGATMLPCADAAAGASCPWNETAWHETLDPSRDFRERQMQQYEARLQQWQLDVQDVERREAERKARQAQRGVVGGGGGGGGGATVGKRDIGNTGPLAPAPPTVPAPAPVPVEAAAALVNQLVNQEEAESPVDDDDQELVPPPKPTRPESHAEFVQNRILRDGLQPGFATITDRRYILRPEAIESVWYMYRITGDAAWQEKGWRMFEAVVRATRTAAGHSAIRDVTQPMAEGDDNTMDNMESFWLAETLKYFYLLFTTPDVVSLDEWVLNTEAHPFKRPV